MDNELRKSLDSSQDDAWIPTVCYMCYNNCGIKVHRQNGVVVKIEGNTDDPHNWGKVCSKGNAGVISLYDPYRVLKPLKRTNPEKGIGADPKWVEITWEEALDIITSKLRKVKADNPKKFAIASLDYFVSAQVSAYAAAFGTPNVWGGGAGYFCGNGVHPVTYLTHGTFYAEPDLHLCDYCILIGSQFGFNVHHEAMLKAQEMADARMRGMKVVVVDPVCSNAAAKADEWVTIRPGTDAAFALALLNVLVNELGIYDAEFLTQYTNSIYLIKPDGRYLRDEESGKPLVWDTVDAKAKPYDAEDLKDPALLGSYRVNGVEVKPAFQLLKEHVQKYTPEAASEVTTIPAETIRRIAKEFGEAARIGSKIVIDGVEFPYRPVAIDFSRGATAHKHSMLTGLSIQLVNMVVGALDVPGGYLGTTPIGPFWDVVTGPDGLLVPARYVFRSFYPYPAREVKRPESLEIFELFPVAPYSRPLFVLNLLQPELFKMDYKPEVLLHCRTNVMMSCSNPQETADALKQIPFIFSIAREIDETTEFADIILPDTHYLETLNPFANGAARSISAGPGQWYWEMGIPVVDPPPGVQHWFDTLIEIADRVGFLGDFNVVLNTMLRLKDPYKLDPSKRYCWEEIGDNWAKSTFGPEHDIEWFKNNGFISWPKKVEEAYPRPFIKPRIPVYFEYFQKAGEEVKKVTEEMGLNWDLSDYQPLPDWKPCPSHVNGRGDFDLVAVNYKSVYHTFSFTAENPWLDDLVRRHPYTYNLMVNTQTAKRKGLKEGDEVWLETEKGYKVKGRIRVTECIHPEVIGFGGDFGHWAEAMPIAKGKGSHFNTLLTVDMNYIDIMTTAVDSCIRVKVYR